MLVESRITILGGAINAVIEAAVYVDDARGKVRDYVAQTTPEGRNANRSLYPGIEESLRGLAEGTRDALDKLVKELLNV